MLFLVLMVASTATAAAPALPDDKPHILTFGGPQNSEFLLDRKPCQRIRGEMHPAHIPVEYWRHRIRMAKAMGLNTIAIYVFWNFHERAEGKFDFTSGLPNIAEFLRLAREVGVWINLRPGPYCCGEWDLGGIPAYLLRYPDTKLRTLKDDHYARAVKRYIHALAQIVKPYMAASGGPILLVQIENEYGSYPRRDHDYLVWLRDLWIKEGIQRPFYTADSPGEGYLKGVVVSGVALLLELKLVELAVGHIDSVVACLPVRFIRSIVFCRASSRARLVMVKTQRCLSCTFPRLDGLEPASSARAIDAPTKKVIKGSK